MTRPSGPPRHRKFSEIRRPVTPARRARIDAIARRMEAAEWLADLRSAAGITQAELAERLGITQGRVSQIEGQDDLLLSTLRDYAEALEADLELAVRFRKTGRRVALGAPAD